jgi:transcriptional regulator with XRE-family HTH domain
MSELRFNLGLNKSELSKYLKQRRKLLGITQIDLAKYCNLSREGIQKIESGKTDLHISTLVKISKFLGFKITIETEEE